MQAEKAKKIVANLDRYVHKDRVFLNNPAVMQGMGLAPLAVAAVSGKSALMLLTAVVLLLTPVRLLCSVLLKNLRQPLLRMICYCGVSAVVYIAVRALLGVVWGSDILTLGIYLPLLAIDPLIVYRSGRPPEPLKKALRKGLMVTAGYCIILMLTGCLRELLSTGKLFGAQLLPFIPLPLLSMPAGGFIMAGLLFALWRAVCSKYLDYVKTEAKVNR